MRVAMPIFNPIKSHKREPRGTYNTTKAERMKYYNQSKWWKLRKAYLIDNPLCAHCLKVGKIVAVEDIHHKVSPFSVKDDNRRAELFWDYDNLEGLCKECHSKFHSRYGRLNDDGTTTKKGD